MKKAVLVLASVYFLLAPKSFSQTPADSSYWPLGLDYTWTYNISSRADTSQYTESIAGDTTIDGKRYFMLDQFVGIIAFPVRQASDTLFFYSGIDSTEHPLFIFSGANSVRWSVDTDAQPVFEFTVGREITLAGRSDTVTTPAGTFYNCIHLRHICFCADAGWTDSWFARGIGRVKTVFQNYFGPGEMLLDHSTLTSIHEPDGRDRPPKTITAQNYPNPASLAENRQTTIRYTIPAASDVQIVLYDALGRKVRTLFAGYKPGGTHEIAFNPASLVSGVYFYRVRSGAIETVKKMILIR